MKREDIKQKAREMALAVGLINLTRRDLCAALGIPDGSFCTVAECTFTELIAELRAEGLNAPAVDLTRKRADPELRRQHILDAALACARKSNYARMTRDEIAAAAGVSMGLVSRYLGTMPKVRRAVMRYAVEKGDASVVAQGLGVGDPHARKAPDALKTEALAVLAG